VLLNVADGYSYLVNTLLRTHPETGTRSIWPSPGDMECLETLDGSEVIPPAESKALLQRLLEPGTREELIYSHEWELGDIGEPITVDHTPRGTAWFPFLACLCFGDLNLVFFQFQ
jgi:hypothetical protein